MRKVFLWILVAVAVAVCGGGAFAHELIVKPNKMEAAKGEALPIELQSTHIFIVKEEVEELARIKAGLFRGGKLEAVALTANEPELRIDASVKIEDDGAILIVAEKDGEIRSTTNEGRMIGSRRELEAKGLKVVSSSKTDKFAKAIVNVSKGDTNFATVTGQELEIVPVTNPADLKVGDYFQVKVLLRGQPVAGPLWATYDGFDTQHQNTFAYYTESDAEGVAWIKLTHPGLWIARTSQINQPGIEGECDFRTVLSVLTFEVK